MQIISDYVEMDHLLSEELEDIASDGKMEDAKPRQNHVRLDFVEIERRWGKFLAKRNGWKRGSFWKVFDGRNMKALNTFQGFDGGRSV